MSLLTNTIELIKNVNETIDNAILSDKWSDVSFLFEVRQTLKKLQEKLEREDTVTRIEIMEGEMQAHRQFESFMWEEYMNEQNEAIEPINVEVK